MPRGYKKCGVCKGTGKVQENSDYEFLMRYPITSRCLNCDGSGLVHSRSGINRKALEKARVKSEEGRVKSEEIELIENGELRIENGEGTEARGLKSTQRPAEASVPERSDGEMIEVTIRCRLTYEQLAQVMKYNEVSQGDK
jgi:hypothetical protein